MAEPYPPADRPPDATPAHAPPAGANGLAAALRAVAPADDTPTIISKTAPAAATPAGAGLVEGLRGKHLAHFELIEPIGVGGMAAVIRARDTQLDRVVALKVLPPEMAADPENVRRFHQEARSAAKLDHENIARVFFCGQDQGLLFIAFEYVEGLNLRVLLERRGRLPVTEAIHYILQIATGLAHAAGRGVVHRDIKPSNIIVTPSGRAKLVDMGLARSLGPQPDGALTQSGVTLGTFDYISPEQALEPRDADVRSDIYSLGCTFYHMLTGHPPVPEGTAAKKLHCHQHVPPVDPRQLNPSITDDVAAVVARMMAKSPADRYQQPEHLVQHLLILAQKIGAPATSPDGVLFVDAPLPAPPQMRPAFLMAAAVVVLIAFIVFLGSPAGPGGTARTGGPRPGTKPGESAVVQENATVKPGPAVAPEKTADTTPAAGTPREPDWFTPQTARELADYLEKNSVARVALAGDLDLTAEGVQGLVFRGRELEIKAADRKTRPTIRLDYPALVRPHWAALTVEGRGTVKLSGLRLVVDATQADILMSAVHFEGTGRITIQECEFVPLNPPDGTAKSRLSAVSVRGVAGEVDVPILWLSHCYFAAGQEAVTVTSGTADVRATQCAFAPQTAALFGLRGRNRHKSELKLSFCSAFLTHGPAFRLEDGHVGDIDASNCVFSRPEADAARPGGGVLLQCGRAAQNFEYLGSGNCYHNLRAYLVRSSADGPAEPVAKLDDFKKQLQVRDSSVELAASPWEAADPLAALTGDDPNKAFRVKLNLTELRRAHEDTPVVGVNVLAAGRLYPSPLPRAEDRKPEAVATRKIVNPTQPASGEYRTLPEAVAAAKSGDEIYIKHNGRLPTEPIRLERPNFELTVQAERGYRPVLALSLSRDPDAALFRVFDGKLTLKGLAFQLEAVQEGLRHTSVVTLQGPGQCVLHDCLTTLAGSDGLHLAVVTLADQAGMMRMESRSGRTHPDVDIHNCFVRGDGDLVCVRASRPFDLEVKNTLAVLRTGALLHVDGAAEDVSALTGSQAVTLQHVTAYLGEHLITLKAGRGVRGLIKTDVVAQDCLFASAAGKSLVRLEGMEPDDQVRRLLSWTAGQEHPNVYSGFAPMLDQVPRNEDTMLMPFDREGWRAFTREPAEAFERVRFTTPPPADGSWAKVLAAHFRAKTDGDPSKVGADVEALSKLFDDAAAAGSPGND